MKIKKVIKSKKSLKKINMFLNLIPKNAKKKISVYSSEKEDFFFLKYKIKDKIVEIRFLRNKKYNFFSKDIKINKKQSNIFDLISIKLGK